MNTKYFFVLLGIFSFTVNFMFTGTKWKDAFPYVRFKVNPNLYGITPENQIKIISDAADLWFNGTDSKFSYSYDGQTTNTQSASPSQLDCSDETKNLLRQLENTVYSTSIPDPYCTSETCALVWSCGDEVLHFDIRINRVETDLKTRIAKEFGFVAGLSRCAVGDTPEQCSAKSVNGQSDPDTNSIMHKFASFAQISPDDKAGMQSLYGAFNNPFPKTGPYVLNSTEVEFLAGAENEFATLLFPNNPAPTPAEKRKSIANIMTHVPATEDQIEMETDQWMYGANPTQIPDPNNPGSFIEIDPNAFNFGVPTKPACDTTTTLHEQNPTSMPPGWTPPPKLRPPDCIYTRPALSATEAKARNAQEMNQFFTALDGMVTGLSNEELSILRINSVISVYAYGNLKDIIPGDDKIDPSQFNEAMERWIGLRQRAIDTFNQRNP